MLLTSHDYPTVAQGLVYGFSRCAVIAPASKRARKTAIQTVPTSERHLANAVRYTLVHTYFQRCLASLLTLKVDMPGTSTAIRSLEITPDKVCVFYR